MTLAYLLGFITTIVSFLIGYWLGRDILKLEAPKEIERMVDKALGRDVKPGIIMRPTQHDLEERKYPKIAEGKREFKKLLDELNIKK